LEEIKYGILFLDRIKLVKKGGINLSITSNNFVDNRTFLNTEFKDVAIYKFELIHKVHF